VRVGIGLELSERARLVQRGRDRVRVYVGGRFVKLDDERERELDSAVDGIAVGEPRLGDCGGVGVRVCIRARVGVRDSIGQRERDRRRVRFGLDVGSGDGERLLGDGGAVALRDAVRLHDGVAERERRGLGIAFRVALPVALCGRDCERCDQVELGERRRVAERAHVAKREREQ